MRQNSGTSKATAERVVRDIRRKTRKHHSVEEKIRIVPEGLHGEESIAELDIVLLLEAVPRYKKEASDPIHLMLADDLVARRRAKTQPKPEAKKT